METAEEALKKIQLALQNLRVSPDVSPHVANYIHNLVLHVLRDTSVQKKLHENPEKLINDLSKI